MFQYAQRYPVPSQMATDGLHFVCVQVQRADADRTVRRRCTGTFGCNTSSETAHRYTNEITMCFPRVETFPKRPVFFRVQSGRKVSRKQARRRHRAADTCKGAQARHSEPLREALHACVYTLN